MRNLAFCCVFAAITGLTATAYGQETPGTEATEIDVEAPVSAVTVYRGRAAVSRRATLAFQPGVYDLQILGLPEAIQPQTMQARLSNGARVLEVQYDEIPMSEVTTPETAELDALIADLERQIDVLRRQYEVVALQERFLEKVAVRTAEDANDDGGTDRLDLDVVREQLQFVTEERVKLIEQRGELDAQNERLTKELEAARARRTAIAGASDVMRLATVAIAVPEAGEQTIDLMYLVSNATWQPTYNIRAAPDGSIVDIEYDAMLTQRTGEDWTNVDMTLSTAQPTLAANPPELDPWYVDIQRSAPAAAAPRRDRGVRVPQEKELATAFGGGALFADAEVAGQGPAVTFHLTRAVTAESNLAAQQRTRIATIQSGGDFVHVAVPLLTEHVYIRGELTNHSDYQLLPGSVSIFVGQDYIGPTSLEAVAPGGRFEMHFGIDPAVHARRMMLEKKTSKTGLFGGGLKTAYEYRIEIENGTGKGIMLELWDRHPVSRSDQITVELADLSHALATDVEYVENHKPQGLLKWDLGIPSGAQGAAVFAVTWGVRVNRAKNIDITPLPE